MKLISGEDVMVTLRLLEGNNITDENIKEAKVIPIALPEQMDSKRKAAFDLYKDENKGRPVVRDTDFNFICPGARSSYFYIEDISKITYKNENDDASKYYKSKIVYPISCYNKDAKDFGYYRPGTDARNAYSILGFIIADTAKTNVFTEAKKDFYLDLLKTYSDRSSDLLYKYKLCLKKKEEVALKREGENSHER